MEIDHKTAIEDGRLTSRELSTGQKKRLAMVLTLLRTKPILVFDEWAADQDPEFRAMFYQKILPGLRAEGRLDDRDGPGKGATFVCIFPLVTDE